MSNRSISRELCLRFAALARADDRGSVLITTAIVIPILLLSIMGGTTVMAALAKRQQLQTIAQAACNRAIKPLRMITMDDSTRLTRAQAMFDKLASERKFTILSRTITAGWLTSQVTAQASVPVMPGFGKQFTITVSVDESCAGVPPYPALNDVILSSNFKTPSGSAVGLTRGGGKWDLFTPQQIGWDGGSGPGVEIQDWSKGFSLNGTIEYLPLGVSSTFVVELDSDNVPGQAPLPAATCGKKGAPAANSSIFRNFELHPGTWRLSLWYRSRLADNPDSTNKVVVYLEGTKPVTAKTAVITMDDGIILWRYRNYDFTVDSYGLYRLTLAAEGCSDSLGGLFNDLKITYVKRPSPEYSDTAPLLPLTQ